MNCVIEKCNPSECPFDDEQLNHVRFEMAWHEGTKEAKTSAERTISGLVGLICDYGSKIEEAKCVLDVDKLIEELQYEVRAYVKDWDR
jgi:hypothetical protein